MNCLVNSACSVIAPRVETVVFIHQACGVEMRSISVE